MTELSDTQLLLLSKAAQRDDHAIQRPDTLKGGAVDKVAASLIRRGYATEVPAQPGMPEWRRDEETGAIALIATAAGLDAIGIESEAGTEIDVQRQVPDLGDMPWGEEGCIRGDPEDSEAIGPHVVEIKTDARTNAGVAETTPLDEAGPENPAGGEAMDAIAEQSPSPPRNGSKQAQAIALLQRPEGATLNGLVQVTGWLPHTTRAALTGLRKRGYAIQKHRADGQPTVYRIASVPSDLVQPETEEADEPPSWTESGAAHAAAGHPEGDA